MRENSEIRGETLLRIFGAEKKKQVQVRIREKHLAPVAAECEQSQPLWRSAANPQQFAEDFLDRRVRQLTQLPQRLAGAGSALK